jgi:hypothetical protein
MKDGKTEGLLVGMLLGSKDGKAKGSLVGRNEGENFGIEDGKTLVRLLVGTMEGA